MTGGKQHIELQARFPYRIAVLELYVSIKRLDLPEGEVYVLIPESRFVQLAYVHLHALLLQLRHAQHMVKMAVGEQYGVTPKAVFLKVCIYLSRVRRIDYNTLVAVIKPHKVSVHTVRAGFYAADCYISVHAVFLA